MRATLPVFPWALVALTLLALALGGSVDLPAQAILAAGAGLFLVVAPPRGPLARTPLVLAGLLLLLALAAFLPAPSVDSTTWRHYLAFEARVPPGWFRTPQPWLTMQGCCLLVVGLGWALYLFHQPWDRESRIQVAMAFVFGVALLAGLAAAAFILNFHVPGWTQEENRGWFPNRNQTADVLALTGIITYALIADRLRKGRISAYFLLAALMPIVTELVISYSRAGILLFFLGLLAWQVWPRAGKRREGSIKWAVLSAALAIILLALFLTWGGDTLSRFESASNPDVTELTDFRLAIQADALRLSLQSPFLGVGLGNFEPIFAFSQTDSINGNRAVHPESDWLWLICELGWFAPMVLIAAIRWWLKRCFPLENKPGETMRSAFIVATFVFIVHGFLDVASHRMGSLLVGLLMASLALPAQTRPVPSRWTPLIFRMFGCIMLGIAAWWGASLRGLNVPPTTATVDRYRAGAAARDASPEEIERASDAGIKIAPLDWNFYFHRGAVEAPDPARMKQALADFSTARALDPYWVAIPLDEGQVWSDASEPDLCFDTWADGIRRAGPMAAEEFRQMVGLASPHSIEREGLAQLALDRVDFLLLILPTAPASEADALLTHLLQIDPQLAHLSKSQRDQLFTAWWTQGDQVRMMELINEHPEWEAETWIYQAKFAARENDFQRACAITARWKEAPPVPFASSDRALSDLQADFKTNPDTLTSGLVLYHAQMRLGKTDDALATLDRLIKLPSHPAYLDYLEAQIYTAKQDWPQAWKSWLAFLSS